MLFPILPYSTFMTSTLIAGVVMVLSSNNWLFLWVGLELNLISFIPMLSSSQSNQEKEATVKYFLVQAVGSGLMLTSVIMILTNKIMTLPLVLSSFMLLMSLLMKTGFAPCHFWFPQVMMSLSWSMSLILATVQKISPLFITFFLTGFWPPYIIILLCLMNSIIGGVGGLNQTQMRALVAYSSIGHLSWMLGMGTLLPMSGIIYFILYLIITSTLIMFMTSLNKSSVTQFNMSLNLPHQLSIVLMLNLLSLAGLPPLMGFFPKLMAMSVLLQFSTPLLLILISGSLMNLFYYLSIFFSMTVNTLKSSKISLNMSMQMMMVILSTLPMIALTSVM